MNDTIESILTAILLLATAVILLGFPLMWLWNWLMPTLFHLPTITFWQACGLQLMAALLFKSNVNVNKN